MNIDDKLREILQALVFDEIEFQDFVNNYMESYVAAIKQAFADERTLTLDQAQLMVKNSHSGCMNGYEWYQRFKDEIFSWAVSSLSEDVDRVMEAAQRASGVDK